VRSIGSSRARTHLGRLLDAVRRGEQFTITVHGKPLALLIPVPGVQRRDATTLIAELRRLRSGHRLRAGKRRIRRLIDTGRL
jgi:prevent-host-death family protein